MGEYGPYRIKQDTINEKSHEKNSKWIGWSINADFKI